jgi:ABC-type molybdate transport system substrate-binding protein
MPGVLALLSNTRWVDVSGATGTCGYDPVIYANIKVGIADPSLAPYGVASQSVLTGRYQLAPPLCDPTNGNPQVHQPCYPNITASLNAVLNREVPIGFVAMSAICSGGIYPTPGNGTSARAYFPIESTNTTPPMLVNNYNPLSQGGIAVVNTPAVTPQNASGRTPARTPSWRTLSRF